MELNRSVRELDSYLKNFSNKFKKRLQNSHQINVLDAGCGNGMTMLGLVKLFPNKISITGYNQSRKHGSKESMYERGIRKNIISKNERGILNKQINFKYFDINKRRNMPFKDNQFDFIYSLGSVYLYNDKIHFLEECNRILKPSGIARIHLLELKTKSIYFAREYLKRPESLDMYWELQGRKKTSILKYLGKFKNVTIGFGKKENGNTILYLELKKSPNFVMGLQPKKFIKNEQGVKSVYKLKVLRRHQH